jgi:subtilisin family serine protease
LRARIAACLALTTLLATTLAVSSHAATGVPSIAKPHAALDAQAAKLPWNTGGTRVVPGRLVVVWRHGAATAATRALSAHLGATTTAAPSNDIDVVQLPAAASEAAAIHRYERSPLVRSAEPDRVASVMAVPNDTHFSEQWALNNAGQAHEETDQGLGPGLTRHGTTDADVDGPEAWAAQTVHDPTVVAVIDTGVDINHPDLQNQLWTNTAELSGSAGVDDDNNGFIDDLHGWDFADHDKNPSPGKGLENSHGTHVAGIVAAEQNNSEGVSGVCPDCQIMALRFGSASGLSLGKEIAAIHYAVANGAKVINLSIGSPVWSPAERTAIQQAGNHGVLVVAAAGNAGEDNDIQFYPDLQHQDWAPSYPASYSVSNILSVAASNDRDQYAYFSQCKDAAVPLWRCGFSSFGHDSVDVAAPGVDILSTVKVGVGHAFGSYEYFDGTSMASPMAAGIAGLVLSENPTDTPVQVKNAVMHGVDHPSSLKLLTMWGKATGVGKSALSGHFTRTQGRVNALGALTNDTTTATTRTDGNIDGARSIDTRRIGTVSWPSDDNDVYKKRLVKGHRYSVTLDGPRGADFDLWIWNPGTKDIFQFTAGCFTRNGPCPAIASASAGRGADEHTTFRARKTGTFFIQVNGWYSHGRYTLRIKRA